MPDTQENTGRNAPQRTQYLLAGRGANWAAEAFRSSHAGFGGRSGLFIVSLGIIVRPRDASFGLGGGGPGFALSCQACQACLQDAIVAPWPIERSYQVPDQRGTKAPGTLHRRSVGFSLLPRKADAALHLPCPRQCA